MYASDILFANSINRNVAPVRLKKEVKITTVRARINKTFNDLLSATILNQNICH